MKNGHRTTRRAEWLLSSRPRGVPCSRSVGTVHGLSKLLGFDLQVQNPFAGCVQHPKVEPLALSRCCFLRSARSNAVYQMYMSASKGAQSVAFFLLLKQFAEVGEIKRLKCKICKWANLQTEKVQLRWANDIQEFWRRRNPSQIPHVPRCLLRFLRERGS